MLSPGYPFRKCVWYFGTENPNNPMVYRVKSRPPVTGRILKIVAFLKKAPSGGITGYRRSRLKPIPYQQIFAGCGASAGRLVRGQDEPLGESSDSVFLLSGHQLSTAHDGDRHHPYFIYEFYCGQVFTRLHWIHLTSAPREVLMQNRASTQTKPRSETNQKRSRVYIHESARDSINRRLEEVNMTFSDYMRHLVQRDIGVYV